MKITLVMAQTADGKVARESGELVDWTPKEDKKLFVEETKRIGVVVMGRKTFDTIGRPLPGRHIIVMTRSASPTPTLSLPPPEGEIKEGAAGTVIYTSDPPHTIVQKLEKAGYKELAVAGGPTINSLFLKADLIHELKLTISARLFGTGLSLFAEHTETKLELLDHRLLTPGTLFVHYRVVSQ